MTLAQLWMPLAQLCQDGHAVTDLRWMLIQSITLDANGMHADATGGRLVNADLQDTQSKLDDAHHYIAAGNMASCRA